AERFRIDQKRVALDHARLLQTTDALGNAGRGQANGSRQVGYAGARVSCQRIKDADVNGIEIAIFVSKAFHRNDLRSCEEIDREPCDGHISTPGSPAI